MSKPNNSIVLSLGLSIILVINAFVFMPLIIYMGNIDSFVMPIWTIVYYYSIPSLIIIGLIIVIGSLVTERHYPRFIAVIAVIGLLVWFQGNILVWEYGLLDGQNINWELHQWRGWVDLCIWVSAFY